MSIKEQIKQLKEDKNAIILAHYYVADEVQEIADYIGDSYYLSKVAKGTDADIIVFCFIYGGKCNDFKSREEGIDARCKGRLCDGSYGEFEKSC